MTNPIESTFATVRLRTARTKDADVNAVDVQPQTPLDWAIEANRTEIADLLRKHGGKTGEELKAEGK